MPSSEGLEFRVRRLVARGINDALGEVFRMSQNEVPYGDEPDAGALSDSGHVVEADPLRLEGHVVYGTAYGAAQHEGWALQHRNGQMVLWVVRDYSMPGRKSHYLSDPLKAVAPRLEVTMGKIIELALKEHE